MRISDWSSDVCSSDLFETVFLARGAHLAAIRRDGLRVVEPDGAFTLPAEATDDPATIGPVDFALFAVKLWDTETAAAQCRPLLGPDTADVSLPNGVDSESDLARLLIPAMTTPELHFL